MVDSSERSNSQLSDSKTIESLLNHLAEFEQTLPDKQKVLLGRMLYGLLDPIDRAGIDASGNNFTDEELALIESLSRGQN